MPSTPAAIASATRPFADESFVPLRFVMPDPKDIGSGLPNWRRPAEVQWIRRELVKADPRNPRKYMDPAELEALKQDIEQYGYRHPLRVRRGNSDVECIAIGGHRRLRVADSLKHTHVPCLLVAGHLPRDVVLFELLADNHHQAAVAPVDLARNYKELMHARGWSIAELARAFHLGQGRVSQVLSLLKLSEQVCEHVNSGAIRFSNGVLLARLPESVQPDVASELIAGALTFEGLKRMVAGDRSPSPGGKLAKARGGGRAVAFATDRVFRGPGGVMVTVKAFQALTDDQIAVALTHAANELRGGKP